MSNRKALVAKAEELGLEVPAGTKTSDLEAMIVDAGGDASATTEDTDPDLEIETSAPDATLDIENKTDAVIEKPEQVRSETRAKPKGKTMEVVIVRGYVPLDEELLEPGEAKLKPGTVIDLPEKEAKSLIKRRIADFPDDEDE